MFNKPKITMKQFKNLILAGALAVGLAGFAVSCNKYGDDIDDLQKQVNTLSSQVSDLQSKIQNGAVITNVTSNSDGVTITTSDGKSYTITNGKDGAKGDKGDAGSSTPGTVWTIGDDGYWYQDGVKTEHKAVPENGAAGSAGAAGEKGDKGDKGETGAAGKDGNWWDIETENGALFFVEYDGVTKEKTGKKVALPAGQGGNGSGITAVWDTQDYELVLYGVAGSDGPVVIYLASTLKSLAFVPKVIFDGLGVISVETFNYPAKTLNKTYPFVVVATKENPGLFLTTAPTVATYRLNPQNANPEDYTFDFINRTAYTRATADQSDLVEFVSGKMDKGLYDVTLKLKKDLLYDTPDHKQDNDIVALRAIAKDKDAAKENIVSDYTYLESKLYWDYRIIHKDGYEVNGPRYYRNKSFLDVDNTIDPTDYNDGAGIKVDGLLNPATVVLNYKGEEDLLDYVYTYSAGYEDVVDKVLDVEYEFWFAGLDATYQEGDDPNAHVVLSTDGNSAKYESKTGEKTNQNAFVKLTGEKGSVIKVNDQFVVNGTPAIGRTPLVYVRSYVKTDDGVKHYLAEAFIKIEIVEEKVEASTGWDVFIIHDVTFDYDKLTAAGTYTGESGTVTAPRQPQKPNFNPNANKDLNVTWTEINQWVLDDNDINMSYATFGAKYDLENPKIVLVKNGLNLEEPGATLPAYPTATNNTVLEDFNNIVNYYKNVEVAPNYYAGVFGDKLSPTNWEQSTNIVDIKLTDHAVADGVNHYVYVVFEAKNKAQNMDVVLKFVYNVPKHEHQFTIFNWILNPDYLLNENPRRPWMLNPDKPANVNAPADLTKYGEVRVKGQADANRSGLTEHFEEYHVDVNIDATYTFEVMNYKTTDVKFEKVNVGVIGATTDGRSTVTLTGYELLAIVEPNNPVIRGMFPNGAATPDIVLSNASRLQDSKEILVKVTEVCNGDAEQTKAGYYYVVFDALKATINFNKVEFGTYRDYSDYALLSELIESVVDESGKEVIKWDGSDWVVADDYRDAATGVLVSIKGLTYPEANDTEASFGGNLTTIEAGQTTPPTTKYTNVTFTEDGIEWWNLGTDLRVDKKFGAVFEIFITPKDSEEPIKIASAEGKFTVLSTENSAAKHPNHYSNGDKVLDPRDMTIAYR